jgi:formyltetrahydrofolate-dependent phosphoribosylglycinamide formyltransferase
MASKKRIGYKQAGVDIDEADRAVAKIRKLAGTTFTPGVLTDIGSFGAGFRLAGWKKPVLISSADGVGTKLKIAFMSGRHNTVGEDLVNHCVNDIAVQGAVPLFFLDYFATGKLEAGVAGQVIEGIARGCRNNGCALIGGETAEMPGLYQPGEYDLAGFIVGAVERKAMLTGDEIRAGDLLLGLPSNGLHTNGYSLARTLLFDVAREKLTVKLADELLRIHRSYLKPIRALIDAGDFRALADDRQHPRRRLASHLQSRDRHGARSREQEAGQGGEGAAQDGRGVLSRRGDCRVGQAPRGLQMMEPGVGSGNSQTKEPAYRADKAAHAVKPGSWESGDRNRKIGILLSGRGSNFEAIARNVAAGAIDAEIAMVISNRPEARGLAVAREMGLNAVCIPSKGIGREAYDATVAAELKRHAVDLVCLAGFMRLLSPAFIREFPMRILNIHPSLLPAFPGLDAQEQALKYGVKISGCTVHFVDENLDAGPIVAQAVVPVLDDDTVETLAKRILKEEHFVYSEAIRFVLAGGWRVDGRRIR